MFLTALLLPVLLCACGNKGPLVLPDKPAAQRDKDEKAPPASGAQPAQKTATDGAATQR
ncbi:MAG: lipoprotein [Rudaea sp.]